MSLLRRKNAPVGRPLIAGMPGRALVAPLLLLTTLAALTGCTESAPGITLFPTREPMPTFAPARPTVVPTAAPSPTPTQPRETPRPAQATPDSGQQNSGVADGFPIPPDRDLFRLARELVPGVGAVNPVVRGPAPALEEGHRETFRLVDLESLEQYDSDFELRLVSPNAYWFVEEGVDVLQSDLEHSADEFEEVIYPRLTAVFGTEWKPGVDGDPHLHIINANLRGVGGYFNSSDEYPSEVQPISNEHEAIYINVRYLPIGSDSYARVLAHELQHAVHWNHDRTEETWVNEGLSELAVTVAGYEESSIQAFRVAGPTSLTTWPAGDFGRAPNYGSASLFMHYLTAHYGGRDDLLALVAEPADGIPGLNAYLRGSGFDVRFQDVFRDWAIANLLDEEAGPYGYPDLEFRVPVYGNLRAGDELTVTTPQYANEYVRLEQADGPVSLQFDGAGTVPLLPEDVGDGCWWSNKGDVIDSTLTSAVDLREVQEATLDFEIWFSIEEDWDFAYLEISGDGGDTWSILETPLTSSEDPLDVAFGPGYTGASEGWQSESVSLLPWAGSRVLVRFQYVTDAAIHDHGLCLRNLHLLSGDATLTTDWTSSGFVWTGNLVRQSYIVQLVYEGKDFGDNRVEEVTLDSANRGRIVIEADPRVRRTIAVIQPMAPATRMKATYRLSLESVE